jgi:hypothetical protein
MALPNIQLLAEPAGLDARFQTLTAQAVLTHRFWTDAYLAAFAPAGGCRLVSSACPMIPKNSRTSQM